jgi:excisionase family DNA binding protein
MDFHEAQLLTTKEVASLLQVAPATLVDWRHEKKGPRYFKMGREVRYKLADVADWEKKSLVPVEPIQV